ncbi:hypothetical protein Pelo_17079 [Pelomyxa schiedti]|nr:hypothetical protein Pelo_17079 [Pelomyxa schiedti]
MQADGEGDTPDVVALYSMLGPNGAVPLARDAPPPLWARDQFLALLGPSAVAALAASSPRSAASSSPCCPLPTTSCPPPSSSSSAARSAAAVHLRRSLCGPCPVHPASCAAETEIETGTGTGSGGVGVGGGGACSCCQVVRLPLCFLRGLWERFVGGTRTVCICFSVDNNVYVLFRHSAEIMGLLEAPRVTSISTLLDYRVPLPHQWEYGIGAHNNEWDVVLEAPEHEGDEPCILVWDELLQPFREYQLPSVQRVLSLRLDTDLEIYYFAEGVITHGLIPMIHTDKDEAPLQIRHVSSHNVDNIGINKLERCLPLCGYLLFSAQFRDEGPVSERLLEMSTGTVHTWLRHNNELKVQATDSMHVCVSSMQNPSTTWVYPLPEVLRAKAFRCEWGHRRRQRANKRPHPPQAVCHQHQQPLYDVVAGCAARGAAAAVAARRAARMGSILWAATVRFFSVGVGTPGGRNIMHAEGGPREGRGGGIARDEHADGIHGEVPHILVTHYATGTQLLRIGMRYSHMKIKRRFSFLF